MQPEEIKVHAQPTHDMVGVLSFLLCGLWGLNSVVGEQKAYTHIWGPKTFISEITSSVCESKASDMSENEGDTIRNWREGKYAAQGLSSGLGWAARYHKVKLQLEDTRALRHLNFMVSGTGILA